MHYTDVKTLANLTQKETSIDGGDDMGLPAMSMVLNGGDKDDDSSGDGGGDYDYNDDDDDNDGKLSTCKRDMEAPVTE